MGTGWRGAGGTATLGATLVVVAGVIDAQTLYVPGLVLLLLGAGSALWVWQSARGIEVRRHVGARRVVEDEPLIVDVEIRAGRLAPPAGELRDTLLRTPAPLAGGRRRTRIRIRARFARRGRRELPVPQVVVRDPLSLASRTVDAAGPAEEVLVLPRVEPVLAVASGGEGDVSAGGRPALAAEVDLDGIRPHRPGTPAARIAWSIYARRGELHDRVLRADSDARPLIVLDLRGTRVESDLDAAVRAAASLTVHLGARGGCALLVPGERRPLQVDEGLRGWPHAHARLALAEDGRGPALAAVGARRGLLIWVAARALAQPPRGLVRAAGVARVLVVPGTIAGRRASFTVAGCSGYALGSTRAPARRLAGLGGRMTTMPGIRAARPARSRRRSCSAGRSRAGRCSFRCALRTARLGDADRARPARQRLGDDRLLRRRCVRAPARGIAAGAHAARAAARRPARAGAGRAAVRGRRPRAAASRALGRARRRHRRGAARDSRGGLALPRRRRLGRDHDHARRHAAGRDRRAAGVLALERRRAALARAGGDDADDDVRDRRHRGPAGQGRVCTAPCSRRCSPRSCSPTASAPGRSPPRRR